MNDMAVEFKRYPFTVAEYHRMFETGVLDARTQVELIDGELIEMPPIGPMHIGRHALITKYLINVMGDRATILPMGSFPLGLHNEPQPDLAIFPFDASFYQGRPYPPPEDFVAFIEISSSSFSFDSRVKMRLYARFGIPDYLIVDPSVIVYSSIANRAPMDMLPYRNSVMIDRSRCNAYKASSFRRTRSSTSGSKYDRR